MGWSHPLRHNKVSVLVRVFGDSMVDGIESSEEIIVPSLLISRSSLELFLITWRYCNGLACFFSSCVSFGSSLVFYPFTGRGSHRK